MFERELSLSLSHFFVAVADNKIIGYGGYWQVEDEAHLINLAVHSDYRSHGIGRQVLQYLIQQAARQGLGKILLEVRESNQPARALYGSMGFRITGMRPKYYVTENAVLMEKDIAANAAL
jgi:ribosomal-protein-alanine N-acetyltransferase